MQQLIDKLYQGTQSLGEDGRIDGRGFGAFLLNPFVDEDKLNQDKQLQYNQRVVQGAGETVGDTGVTALDSTFDAEGKVIRAQRNRANQKEETAYTRSMEPLRLQMAAQDRRLDAAEAARQDERADNLMFTRMQMEREDKRYNERLMREERNRRQESIMALTQGLAALGAAFAM